MKRLFIHSEELNKITTQFPTPFHLYDEQLIRQQARALKKAFSWNPNFKEYFAVKANPNPVILKILQQEGCGVDCSSYTELMLAKGTGFKGEDIMFSSNVTPKKDMRMAWDLGALINLDDISHIDFLESVAGIPKRVVLRFNPGNDFIIGNDIMSRPGDAKYGFTKTQLIDGIRDLEKRGAEQFGLHAFLSSNTLHPEYYIELAKLLFHTAVDIGEMTGVSISSINLSGGIGVPYRPEDTSVDINGVGESIESAYNEMLVPAGLKNVALHTELGRWMLAEAGVLVTRVIHEKHIYKDYLGLDACAAHLLRPAMYNAYHHITVVGKEDEPTAGVWDVTGGLCENNDKFAIDRPLPKVGRGDVIAIHDTGAHGHAMGYNYNGKLRCAEILRESKGKVRLIRRAETPQDYFATLDVVDEFTRTQVHL